jgi:hypothetical protein
MNTRDKSFNPTVTECPDYPDCLSSIARRDFAPAIEWLVSVRDDYLNDPWSLSEIDQCLGHAYFEMGAYQQSLEQLLLSLSEISTMSSDPGWYYFSVLRCWRKLNMEMAIIAFCDSIRFFGELSHSYGSHLYWLELYSSSPELLTPRTEIVQLTNGIASVFDLQPISCSCKPDQLLTLVLDCVKERDRRDEEMSQKRLRQS